MNESGEQMLNRWFGFEPVRDEVGTEPGEDVPRDAERPMPELRAEPLESEETDADADPELSSVDNRPRTVAEELVTVGDQSDVDVEVVTAADAQEGLVGEGDVTAPSYAAARLLEIATFHADSLVQAAREEAQLLETQALARAEQILQAGRADAEAREESMSAREEEQRLGLERARVEADRELEARRVEVEERVGHLLEFEGQLRTYLISYFNDQQEMLHRSPVVTLMASADAAESRVS